MPPSTVRGASPRARLPSSCGWCYPARVQIVGRPVMAAQRSVPVSVTPEAAARVAELGAADALDRMLEKVPECVPGLIEVRVILVPDPEEGADPAVVLHARVDSRVGIDNAGRWTWRRWL